MAPSTKLALANALKAQLQKKFLDDITVKELVEACEINRQTFYYHFQDIYDLLRWLLEHETAEALGGAEDWQAALLDAFRYIRDNHMVIYHIYRSAGRDNLLDCPFYSLARAIASASLEREAREAAGLTQERFAELIGVSPQNVSCVERGLAGVSLTVLRRMCEILHVSSDALLLGKPAGNDVEALTRRLEQLPPEQFRVVRDVINSVLELTVLPEEKKGPES